MLKIYVKYSWKQRCVYKPIRKTINIQNLEAEKGMKRLFARLQNHLKANSQIKEKDIGFIEKIDTSETNL